MFVNLMLCWNYFNYAPVVVTSAWKEWKYTTLDHLQCFENMWEPIKPFKCVWYQLFKAMSSVIDIQRHAGLLSRLPKDEYWHSLKQSWGTFAMLNVHDYICPKCPCCLFCSLRWDKSWSIHLQFCATHPLIPKSKAYMSLLWSTWKLLCLWFKG